MTRKFRPKFVITNRITSGLTMIERERGFLEAAELSEWIRSMSDRALVLEAHHTTHIEGTQLTLDQARRLLAGEDVSNVDPNDVRELLNYRRAFDFVSKYLDSAEYITGELILEIHKRLVEGVRGGAAAPSEYRNIQNYQPADLPTQGGHTMNLRQIHDITCDRLETQLETEGKV